MRKRVTLKTVAESLGLSEPTVSLALSENPRVSKRTQSLVKQTCHDLGYYPKTATRRAAPRKEKRIGFISISSDGAESSVLNSLLLRKFSECGLERRMRFEFLYIDASLPTSQQLKMLDSYSLDLDGLILVDLVKEEVVEELNCKEKPFIVLGNVCPDHVIDYNKYKATVIGYEETGLIRSVINRKLKEQKVPLVYVGPKHDKGMSFDRWLDGCKLALLDNDMPVDNSLLHPEVKTNARLEALAEQFFNMEPRPGLFVVPFRNQALHLRQASKLLGWDIPTSSFIAMGNKSTAVDLGLEKAVTIDYLPDYLVDTSLQQLDLLFTKPKNWYEVIRVYPHVHNL